jgi:RHS repeat-associated protein
MQTNAAHSWGGEKPDIRVWYGGLVDGMRDASGQMYMRNRYYDPATGQFTQTDPIGLAGGMNAYGFAAGDPVSYSDPYGLCPYTGNSRSSDLSDCPASSAHITEAFSLMSQTEQGRAVTDWYINSNTEVVSGSCGAPEVVACYSGGDDFVTVSSSGSALFRAGQIIHEGAHKRLYDGGWDEADDHQTHEMVAHFTEFEFYRSFDAAARRDPDLKKDYRGTSRTRTVS